MTDPTIQDVIDMISVKGDLSLAKVMIHSGCDGKPDLLAYKLAFVCTELHKPKYDIPYIANKFMGMFNTY